ncbi:MAG: high-potential iron-sulfur protein [Pseudomonadota bacterium]|nr:high-potential iron-sulfur protein [Pseudomonadota bacterium]
MMKRLLSRRELVGVLALGGAAALAVRRTSAAEGQKLDPKDPAAAALGYVENAADVNVKKFPAYVKGSSCVDCLQLGGKAGDPYRPCTLFPGKLVAVGGWCSGWTAEI